MLFTYEYRYVITLLIRLKISTAPRGAGITSNYDY
jgi:hypothetical protein